MSKTIKQIADELGVSKQAVTKCIDNLGLRSTLTKNGNYFVVGDTQEKAIKQAFAANQTANQNANQNANQTPTELAAVINVLQTTIDTLKGQLNAKDEQMREQLRKDADRLRDEYSKEYTRLLDVHMEAEMSIMRKEEAEKKLLELNEAYENDMNKLKAEYQEKLDKLNNEYSEEIFAKVSAIRAISEKLSHGEKKLTKQEQETVMSVAANVGRIEAEYTELKKDLKQQQDKLSEKENDLNWRICNQQTLIVQESRIRAERLSQKAIEDAQRLQHSAEQQLYTEKQEREKNINEALKPYRRKVNRLNQELDYVRKVCEYATKEPYEETERRYEKHMDELAQERSWGGRSR